MARYAIDHRIDRAEGLKGFDAAGYAFDAALSSTSDWVFIRPQPAPKNRALTLLRARDFLPPRPRFRRQHKEDRAWPSTTD